MHNSVEDFIISLRAGDVFLFHGKVETEQKHYQVILNKRIHTETKLIFASVATKQIEKRQSFINKRCLNPETLVIIQAGEVTFLKLDSCFDCNSLIQYDQYSLFGDYLSGRLMPQGRLPENILERLYNGIEVSEMLSERDKRIIRGE